MTKIDEYLVSNPIFTPAVVGFLIKGDYILLGLRKKVSFGLGENLISGIGGKIGDSEEIKEETAEQALAREFKEEIEVTPVKFKECGTAKFIFPQKPKWNQLVKIYIINSWLGKPRETEAIKPLWFKKTQLPEDRMWHDNKIWIPRILKGEKVNMIFLFDQDNKVEEFKDV